MPSQLSTATRLLVPQEMSQIHGEVKRGTLEARAHLQHYHTNLVTSLVKLLSRFSYFAFAAAASDLAFESLSYNQTTHQT